MRRLRRRSERIEVGQLRQDESDGAVVTSMRVQCPGAEDRRLRMRIHGSSLADVDRSATPFLPIATLLALGTARDLRLDDPVDGHALEGAETAARLLASWFGWREPRMTAAVLPAPSAVADGTGLFFSRGLDSMATLLTRQGEFTHLIGIDWVDPPYATAGTREIWDATQAAATEIGLPLVRVTTDARQVLEPAVGWDQSHGTVLGALALLHSPHLRRVWIGSAYRGDLLVPHGSHPELDPLWSSSRVEIVHRTELGGRVDKASIVGRNAFASRWLKVCWERDGNGNCGRCAKCLGTMTAFALAGTSDAVRERFDGDLTVEAVRGIVDEPRIAIPNILELLDRLEPDDPLYEPWSMALATKRTQPSVVRLA